MTDYKTHISMFFIVHITTFDLWKFFLTSTKKRSYDRLQDPYADKTLFRERDRQKLLYSKKTIVKSMRLYILI